MQKKHQELNQHTTNYANDEVGDLVKIYEAHKAFNEELLHAKPAGYAEPATLRWQVTDKGTGG